VSAREEAMSYLFLLVLALGLAPEAPSFSSARGTEVRRAGS